MEWISVKDRLPLSEYQGEENHGIIGTYIVHLSIPDDPNEQSEVSYADYLTGTGWCYPGSGGVPHDFWANKITHWMEFPKAPREFLKSITSGCKARGSAALTSRWLPPSQRRKF